MEKPPFKLSIRLNIKDQSALEVPPQEYVYRWDRIFGAATAVILVLAAFIGGGWYWLKTPAPETVAEAEAEPITLVQPDPVAEPEPEPELEPEAVASVETVTITPEVVAPVLVEETDSADVHILSDHFTHAQLTSDVQHGEPIDHAGARIPMNEKGLIRVYLYTEMEGLQGRTLYHDWYLGDQRMARVTMRPQAATVAASSSKFIDRHMLGNWRVEVHSSDGEPMVRTAFEVY